MNPELAPITIFFGGSGSREKSQVSSEEILKKISRGVVPLIRTANAAEGKDRKTVDYDIALPDEYTGGEDIISDLIDGKLTSDNIAKFVIVNPPTREEWRKRADLFAQVKERTKLVEKPRRQGLSQQQETTIAVLEAWSVFCRVMGGENISPLEYIEKTQGKKPESVPEAILNAQKEIVVNILKETYKIDYERGQIEEFRAQHYEPEFVNKLQDGQEEFFNAVSNAVGRNITPEIRFEEKNDPDEPWLNWSSGLARNFVTAVNTSDRHNSRKTQGRAEIIRDHERTHHAQAFDWRIRIEKGELLPSLGVTSVITPIQISCEGIAQTIHEYIPELKKLLTPLGELELEIEGLRQMVYGNVHILVNSDNKITEKEIIDYVHDFYPAEPEDEIKKQIKDRKDNPRQKSYLYSYAEGYRLFKWYAQNLNQKGRTDLLKFVFDEPTTPKQVFNHFMWLITDPQDTYGKLKVPYGINGQEFPIFSSASNEN